MIIVCKVALTAAIIFSALVIGVLLADMLTDFKYDWLNNIAANIVNIFLRGLLAAIVIVMIAICSIGVWAVWTQM